MVVPGDGETQREENSFRIWVIPAATGLRNKHEKPQTLGKLVCTQFVFTQQAASVWLRGHLMRRSAVMWALGERRELRDKILDKNANEVKVMASITRLCCFQLHKCFKDEFLGQEKDSTNTI